MASFSNLPRSYKVFLREEFLYNLTERQGSLVDALLIGTHSYKNQVPGFTVVIRSCGGLFHNIPPHAILFKRDAPPMTVEQCAYHNCPDSNVDTFYIDYLRLYSECAVFIKGSKDPIKGSYLFTLDHYLDNILHHAIQLELGQFVVYPSHKVLFSTPEAVEKTLPKWQKLRKDWSV